MDSPQLNTDIGTGDVNNISSGIGMTISKEQARGALRLGTRRHEEKNFRAAWGVQRWLKNKGAWYQARALREKLLASLQKAGTPDGGPTGPSSPEPSSIPTGLFDGDPLANEHCSPIVGAGWC